MSVDIFEHIKIMAMSDAEKIALIDSSTEYLELLRTDESMSVRIRAKMRISEETAAEDMRRAQATTRAEEIAGLEVKANSSDFGERCRAKVILRKYRKVEYCE